MAKLRLDLLHPSVKEAIEAFEGEITGTITLTGGYSSPRYPIYQAHQKAFWKRIGWKAAASITANLAVPAIIGITAQLDKGPKAAAIIATFVGGLVGNIWAYYDAVRKPTSNELDILIPGLTLTDTQRWYARAFLQISESALSDEFKVEAIGQLNALLDDNIKLLDQRRRISEIVLPGSAEVTAGDDIARLQARLDATTDEGAKQIYAESLAMAMNRVHRQKDAQGIVDRIDAQLELVNQTMATLMDGISILGGTNTVSVEPIDGLRERIQDVRSQTESIDTAIRELHVGSRP